MEPEEVEAVLETIWDLHDKVSDAIHVLSRAHFLRSVRRRAVAGDKPGVLVHVKGGSLAADGEDEAATLEAVAGEARSLHAIRAALEDMEDRFECFLAVQSQQQAEQDIALARLEQSRILLSIRLKEHHGKNYEVIEEALDFVDNVYQKVLPFPSVNKFDQTRRHSAADNTDNREGGSNFLVTMVASSLALAKNSFSLEKFGGLVGNSAVLAFGMMTLLQLHRMTSGGQSPSFGNFKKMNQDCSPQLKILHQGSTMNHLNVSMAKG